MKGPSSLTFYLWGHLTTLRTAALVLHAGFRFQPWSSSADRLQQQPEAVSREEASKSQQQTEDTCSQSKMSTTASRAPHCCPHIQQNIIHPPIHPSGCRLSSELFSPAKFFQFLLMDREVFLDLSILKMLLLRAPPGCPSSSSLRLQTAAGTMSDRHLCHISDVSKDESPQSHTFIRVDCPGQTGAFLLVLLSLFISY